MVNAQQWLDANYPKEKRSEIYEIYLNEPNLEGELDLSDFTWGVRVYISLAVDSNQIKINNLPEYGEITKLFSAQAWLDQNYPKNGTCIEKQKTHNYETEKFEEKNQENFGKIRSEIIELDIKKQNLEGSLDLSDFTNLKELYCDYNKLISLNLTNCSQLEEIDCYNNQLTNLDISKNDKLTKLNCGSNQLTNLILPSNPTNLKELDLRNNNFPPQGLFFLTPYTNLERLYLGNLGSLAGINQDIYNRFTGSLDYLSGMQQLKELDISDNDINEVNIDKLPRSLEKIKYSTTDRPDCQLTKIIPYLEPIKWGWCEKCLQPNTSENWCQPCAEKEWKYLTGQELIEKFIEQQKKRSENSIQWIPYEQFTNIEYLAKGGFSKIYKAKWQGKESEKWNGEKEEYEKLNYTEVVLKSLTNFPNITLEFLQEISNTKLVDGDDIVPCYGISQDPETKNYVMVMGYMSEGNLQQYLKNNFAELTWENKMDKLWHIAIGLKNIHYQGLVHHDFHSGNILNSYSNSYITDLGLSRLANSQQEEGQIFGVIPYVAPEVLQGKPYTKASDIYSFSIIAAEIITGLPPYHDREHDASLAIAICQGLRPQFQIKIPQLLEDLINRCWDINPDQRPSAEELWKILWDWYMEIINKKATPFYQQIQEAEVYNQTLPQEVRFPKYETHLGAVYHSKAINTKQITELLTTNLEDKLVTLNLDEFTISEEDNQTELETQTEIPPKKD